MRLLLDEHISAVVAQRLRERGHDVVAVAEREELRGSLDEDVFGLAIAERRAVATYDKRFRVLARHRLTGDEHHFGLVLLARTAIPEGGPGYGRLISALDAYLTAHPNDDELMDLEWWPE